MISLSPQGSYESLRAASASPGSTGSLGKSPINSSNGLLMASLPGTLIIILNNFTVKSLFTILCALRVCKVHVYNVKFSLT